MFKAVTWASICQPVGDFRCSLKNLYPTPASCDNLLEFPSLESSSEADNRGTGGSSCPSSSLTTPSTCTVEVTVVSWFSYKHHCSVTQASWIVWRATRIGPGIQSKRMHVMCCKLLKLTMCVCVCLLLQGPCWSALQLSSTTCYGPRCKLSYMLSNVVMQSCWVCEHKQQDFFFLPVQVTSRIRERSIENQLTQAVYIVPGHYLHKRTQLFPHRIAVLSIRVTIGVEMSQSCVHT